MKKIALFLSMAVLAMACEKPVAEPKITAPDEVSIPVEGTEEVDVFVEFNSTAAWTASLKEASDWCLISPDKGEAGDAKVKVIATASDSKDPRVATLVITAGVTVKEVSLVQGYVPAFDIVEDEKTVGPEGGKVSFEFKTNLPYEVKIDAGIDWLKLVPASKAYADGAITLEVDPFDELDGSREAEVRVEIEGFNPLLLIVGQDGPSSVMWSINMQDVLPRIGSFTRGEQVIPTNVSMALFNGDVLVCAGDDSDVVILDKNSGEKKGVLSFAKDKPGYITNDDAGNLVYCTRVWNYWLDYQFFSIYYMRPGDSAPTMLCTATSESYAPSYLGAGLSVRGDVTKNAAILAPWEGVAGVTGDNMVLCWPVSNGVAGDFVKGTITGMVAIDWMSGYWCQSPDNFPGMVLMSDKLSDGALFSCYNENALYYVDSNFACTKLVDAIVDSNNAANAMDLRTINGKPYFAVSAGCFFPEWGITPVLDIYDADTKTLITSCLTSNYADGASGVGASAAVRLEAAQYGLNVYHINNNCSSIEAIKVPLK